MNTSSHPGGYNPELMHETLRAVTVLDQAGSPVKPTQLYRDPVLSERYEADVWLVDEIYQTTGSYKVRGATNFMLQQVNAGQEAVITSDGNASKGAAEAARRFGIDLTVFMRRNVPTQKLVGTQRAGGDKVQIKLHGTTYDEARQAADAYTAERPNETVTVEAFDHPLVVAGQGTLGVEITDHLPHIDMLVGPVGGGGLMGGCGNAVRFKNPQARIVGVEPAGAESMAHGMALGRNESLRGALDTFVDGAAVSQVGAYTLSIAQQLGMEMISVDNETLRVATTSLWEAGIPAELAASLGYAGIPQCGDIRGKTVAVIISGGNLSRERYEEQIRIPEVALS